MCKLEILKLAAEIYAENSVGGNLHIVLDDGNLDNDDIVSCIHKAQDDGDFKAAKLGRMLMALTMRQRQEIYECYPYSGYDDAQWEEDEIKLLKEENKLLKGAMNADDERLRKAGERVGIIAGCDNPDSFADKILGLRAKVAELEAKLKDEIKTHAFTRELMLGYMDDSRQADRGRRDKQVVIEYLEDELQEQTTEKKEG